MYFGECCVPLYVWECVNVCRARMCLCVCCELVGAKMGGVSVALDSKDDLLNLRASLTQLRRSRMANIDSSLSNIFPSPRFPLLFSLFNNRKYHINQRHMYRLWF